MRADEHVAPRHIVSLVMCRSSSRSTWVRKKGEDGRISRQEEKRGGQSGRPKETGAAQGHGGKPHKGKGPSVTHKKGVGKNFPKEGVNDSQKEREKIR